MQLGEAVLKLRADGSGLEADVESAGQRASSKLRSIFAGAAVGAALKQSIDAASGLNEAINVTEITFGSAQGTIDEFASTSAQALGQSERAAREAAAGFGGLLLNLGFTEEAAADTSIQLTTLASDLASSFNTEPAEAAEALGSALRGESEPIQRYNVLLQEQAVNAEAVRLGLANSTSEVDQNAKVQARLSLIMQQTSRYQGDFAATSEGAANAQRIAAAEAEDAAASLGQNFLPIYERIVAVVGDVANIFGSLPGPVQTAVVALAGLAALSGPIGFLKDLGSSILPVVRVALDRAAVGAYDFAGRLGSVGLAAGGVGIALGLLGAVYAAVQAREQEAEERSNRYAEALERQAEAGEAAGNAALAEAIAAEVSIDAAERLGISAEQVTDAVTNQGTAWAELAATRDALQAKGGGLTGEETAIVNMINAIEDQRNSLAGQQDAQEGSNDAAAEGAAIQEELGGQVALTAEQIEELTGALDILLGSFLDVPDATRELAASFEEAFATLLENGPTAFNDVSEAGRENREVLDGIVQSTNDLVTAQVEQDATGIQVATTIQLQRESLLAARDAGLITTETFQFYDGVLRGMLTTVETQFQQPGLAEGSAAVIWFRQNVLGIPPERQTTVFAETALAQSRIDMIEQRLRNLNGQSATVKVFAEAFGSAFNQFAEGTPSAPPGMAWVGEEGPELVNFRGGEEVIPAGRSKQVASSGGGGGASTGAIEAAVERGIERGLARAHLTVEVADVATSIRRRENGQRRFPR